jgi:hypothetical protein
MDFLLSIPVMVLSQHFVTQKLDLLLRVDVRDNERAVPLQNEASSYVHWRR